MATSLCDKRCLKHLKPDAKNYLMANPYNKKSTMIGCGPLMFVNHACEPNVRYEMESPTTKIVRCRVLKSIGSGEEILENYPSLVDKCMCGKCRNKST